MNEPLDFEPPVQGINVTPLVDVCLVLVLIFMVTSPFFVKPLLDVKLPQAVVADSESRQNVTITLSAEGECAINDVSVPCAELEGALREHLRKTDVRFLLIRADERVSSGAVQDAMKMAQRRGLKRIAFATLPKIQ